MFVIHIIHFSILVKMELDGFPFYFPQRYASAEPNKKGEIYVNNIFLSLIELEI